MELKMTDELKHSIQRHLDRGEFSTPEAVVQAALFHLDEYSESVAAIDASFEDEKAGRIQPLHEVEAELRQKHGFAPRS